MKYVFKRVYLYCICVNSPIDADAPKSKTQIFHIKIQETFNKMICFFVSKNNSKLDNLF